MLDRKRTCSDLKSRCRVYFQSIRLSKQQVLLHFLSMHCKCRSTIQIEDKQTPVSSFWCACRNNIPEEFLEKVTAVGARVDDVVQEDVLLLKVDVEGFEPAVIASAEGLLQNHK